MELTIDFLKQIALKVFDVVSPLLGTKEAAIKTKKGAGGDISMNIDIAAENVIIETLREANLDLLLISEELGEKFIGDKEKALKNQSVLIVDPIDGSNNAVRGVPYCSVSIAYAIGNKTNDIIKAVVINLNNKDIYWAEKGKGAYLNKTKIHVSDLGIADKCFFELNLPMNNYMKTLQDMVPIIGKFYRMRILGSSALSLCQIASGSMDVFINLRNSNRLVDVAAGMLILKEAEGKFFSIDGSDIDHPLSINIKFPFVACNVKLESYLKEELKINLVH
ncbi:MAG: inositol monophosphatase family protein [Promethearchaeota archaeon]|jgi:fructose-1,6-bisphosphatase/inositol monophosphatase family enzyme